MTKIFLSSLDVNIDNLSDQAIYQSKYLLVTFFYGRKVIKNPRFLEALKYFNEKDHLIFDSGAFSFMNGQKASEKEMDEYCREYVKFINKYHIKHFVELDVDALFGYHKALEYRKYIEEQTERQCIPIFHKSRGKKAFMKMCDEYKYAGIGGIAIKNIKKNEYRYFKQLNSYARFHGCRLHAMGFTPSKGINSYGFYSSDSSSWNSGPRFGTVYKFKNTAIKAIPHPKGYRLKIDIDTIQNHNWLEWCKYQRYVDRG